MSQNPDHLYWNQAKADELIPSHMHGGLYRYLVSGIEPGDFLMAVLENNLREAVGRADHINQPKLPDYIRYLYNYAPSKCWGSPEKVAAWVEMHAEAEHSRERTKPNGNE